MDIGKVLSLTLPDNNESGTWATAGRRCEHMHQLAQSKVLNQNSLFCTVLFLLYELPIEEGQKDVAELKWTPPKYNMTLAQIGFQLTASVWPRGGRVWWPGFARAESGCRSKALAARNGAPAVRAAQWTVRSSVQSSVPLGRRWIR